MLYISQPFFDDGIIAYEVE